MSDQPWNLAQARIAQYRIMIGSGSAKRLRMLRVRIGLLRYGFQNLNNAARGMPPGIAAQWSSRPTKGVRRSAGKRRRISHPAGSFNSLSHSPGASPFSMALLWLSGKNLPPASAMWRLRTTFMRMPWCRVALISGWIFAVQVRHFSAKCQFPLFCRVWHCIALR
ncbi:hypothetical protein [Breoghania sp. L-A4]|uniref:hypothetical protein n=1 Tax=Breoghania sp. L-A4 TaxID=2304600 RepID=UPI0013C36167|nr:hypothetical protein [Breoghania sp. L-A4]